MRATDERRVTVIGAGIVGIATALQLQRARFRVTVGDRLPPGEGCSFGNAGLISPASVVPFSQPDMIWRVPGYLADPHGPLAIRWRYFPQASSSPNSRRARRP
jgi:D-amino-acid dehydrogenase